MISKGAFGNSGQRFELRPNRSATWQEIKLFFAVLATICLGIATGFSLAGFWPVLPFAGIEVAVLGLCLWLSARDCNAVEIIDINGRLLAIEKSNQNTGKTWKFERAWAQIRLEPSKFKQHPSKLLIGSHGKLVHCGSFLTETERRRLARELKTAVIDSQTGY